MNEAVLAHTVAAARTDRHERSVRHARDCVCLATVTSEPLAAELIDQAVELWVAARAAVPATG